MIRFASFFCLILIICALSGCKGTKKKSTEKENSSLKQAAYAYNFEFVKRKTAVHQICNEWNLLMSDSVVTNANLLEFQLADKFPVELDTGLVVDTLSNEFLVAASLIKPKIDSLLSQQKGLIRAYIVSVDGWFITVPSINPSVYPIKQHRIDRFFSASLLDTSLTKYGLWYSDIVIDPLINTEVRSYRQALEVDGKRLGWLVVQASTVYDLELLSSFGSDFLIADYEGSIVYVDEEAATRIALPIAFIETSLSNEWSNAKSLNRITIENARNPKAKMALNRIFDGSVEKGEFINQQAQVVLLATDMSEIRCKLVKIFEH